MSVLNKALLAHAGEKCLNVSEDTASLHVVLGYEALGYGLHVQPLLHAVPDDGRGLVSLTMPWKSRLASPVAMTTAWPATSRIAKPCLILMGIPFIIVD